MSGKQLLKLAYDKGFQLDRITGSHHILVKGDVTITIPVHGNKDLPPGTLHRILRDMGLK